MNQLNNGQSIACQLQKGKCQEIDATRRLKELVNKRKLSKGEL